MPKQDRKPMSLREGKLYLNGEEVLDTITGQFVLSPDVKEYRVAGQRGMSRRWLGHDITGNLSQYKATPWLKNAVKEYLATGKTPVFQLTGINDDPASDYGEAYGSNVVTLTGVVPTGDLKLFDLDADGELITEEIDFAASDVIM